MERVDEENEHGKNCKEKYRGKRTRQGQKWMDTIEKNGKERGKSWIKQQGTEKSGRNLQRLPDDEKALEKRRR